MPFRATALLLIAACTMLVPTGCKKPTEEIPTPDVEIAQATDDGPIDIYRDSMPGIVGFCWGQNASGAVGLPETSGSVMIWRTLFRFDLAGWSTGDADFYVYCSGVSGTALGLEFVAVDDFDSVPYRVIPSDVSALWNLVASGQSLGTVTPTDTGWVHIKVPAARLQAAKTATGFLGLVVKAATEQIVPGNSLDLATWESIGLPKPFLAW
jgi:hypothetical protein